MDASHLSGRARSRLRQAAVSVERLEGRTLLSGTTIADVATLPAPIEAGPMTVTRDANLWFAEVGHAGGPALGKLSPSGARTEVVLPSADNGDTVAALAS